jgi:hypothetical protein
MAPPYLVYSNPILLLFTATHYRLAFHSCNDSVFHQAQGLTGSMDIGLCVYVHRGAKKQRKNTLVNYSSIFCTGALSKNSPSSIFFLSSRVSFSALYRSDCLSVTGICCPFSSIAPRLPLRAPYGQEDKQESRGWTILRDLTLFATRAVFL